MKVKKVTVGILLVFGMAMIGAGQGEGCGGMRGGSNGGGGHHCCGGSDDDGRNYYFSPLGGPPPGDYPSPGDGPPSPGDDEPSLPYECPVLITLIQADSPYLNDLYMGDNHNTLLIDDSSGSVGDIVMERYGPGAMSFHLNVNDGENSYPVFSDTQWAMVDQISRDTWMIRFDDVPDPVHCDYDFNDVVIVVEVIDCDSLTEPPPEQSSPIVVPEGGVSKVHVNFIEATFDAGDLYLDGDPPELLIEKGSAEKGASARNFFAAYEELVFILATGDADLYSDDPAAALVERITDNNYRINYDTDGDGDFEDAIVHVVLTPNN